jgi:hypothetical protein
MERLVASIKGRLLNVSRSSGRDYQMLLERFAMGRLLWRLAHSGRVFVLKGAQLFSVWEELPHRPTRDLDLLSYGDPSPEAMKTFFDEMLAAHANPEDGIVWSEVTTSLIRDEQIYMGVRVAVVALLDRSRMPLQIDIGFGDAITPPPVELAWRELLDFPAARLLTYPPETVIAEKVNAASELGMGNSRMKDFFDLDWLCRHLEFDHTTLHAAVKATFANRGTELPTEPLLAMTPTFAEDKGKLTQWSAFLRKNQLTADALPVIIKRLHGFLHPVLFPSSESSGMKWKPDVGWH